VSRIKKSAKRRRVKPRASAKPFLIKNKFIPRGRIILAGDKSIAHRALILSALTCGRTNLKNFPLHEDSLATLNALITLGVRIRRNGSEVLIYGRGKQGLKACANPVFTHNSGTTLRLLLGVLAGMNFKTKVTAAQALSRRPMSRVTVPLRLMGVQISARIKNKEEYAPMVIRGGNLRGIVYRPKVASAQVKSAVLLAGLFAQGKTQVCERVSTRDHTERMLKNFGANISVNNNRVILDPVRCLRSPGQIYIPGDISSAAFFIVLASIIPGARIVIERAGLNPGRTGIIKVLKRMGAKINIALCRGAADGEPMGQLIAQSSRLNGTVVSAQEIPSLIDELPVLMVAACFAEGATVIKGVAELRVKETDRINSMLVNLKAMGADIRVNKAGRQENLVINCRDRLYGASLKSFGDHRTAMSMVVAAMAADGESRLDDINCINKSFPGFLRTLQGLK